MKQNKNSVVTIRKIKIMKKIMKNSFVIALATSGMFMMNSCKKAEVEDVTKKQSHAKVYEKLPEIQMHSLSQARKMYAFAAGVLKLKSSKFRLATDDESFDDSGCATVTRDTSSLPYTAHVDFGPSGCIGTDGLLYTGSVDFVYNDIDLDLPGGFAQCTFNNFARGTEELINGTFSLENLGFNGAGNPYGKLIVDFTTNLKSLGIEFRGTNTFTLEGGMYDDKGEICAWTGGGTGLTSDGFSYTQTIIEPLILSECTDYYDFYNKGIIQLESPSFDTKFVDYGDGTCDNIAYVVQGPNRNFVILEE